MISPLYLNRARSLLKALMVFGYEVKDPERYGVFALDESQNITAIIEKPTVAPSPYAVTGLYFLRRLRRQHRTLSEAPPHAGSLRSPMSTTPIFSANSFRCASLDEAFAWLDTGTHDAPPESLYLCSNDPGAPRPSRSPVLKKIAFQQGWISLAELQILAARALLQRLRASTSKPSLNLKSSHFLHRNKKFILQECCGKKLEVSSGYGSIRLS
jgi:glucose-1-phosphate thymidylyltransferase